VDRSKAMMIPFASPRTIEAAIPRIVAHLAADGLLGYPTETVYGLGSIPTETALDRLAALKGRAPGKPFLLLVTGLPMLTSCGLVLNASARALAREFWPGPLTLVLRGAEGRLPDRLRGPEGGIAVRWTSHLGIAALIAATGQPLASTSANLPGGATAPGAEGIVALFPDAVASGALMVLDGGVLGNVPPSTLVDCTGSSPTLVREGAIPLAELRRRVGALAP
jgi:L-threonylcarbamoyladenylate synthase